MRVAGSEVIRDTLGPVAVARGVSNSGLIKPAFFELFPKFFSVRALWFAEAIRRSID